MRLLSRALPLIERLTPGVVWRGNPKRNEVALTFDDGPEPQVTLALLDLLDVYECPATFFLIGSRVGEHPEIAREIARRGHEIGNHSWSHRSLFILGPEATRAEFRRTQKAIQETCGETPTWIRPPFGHISPAFLQILSTEPGWRGIVCDVLPGDWPGGAPAEKVVEHVRERARPGSIICLHDGGNPRVLQIAGKVIEAVREKRLQIGPLVTVCHKV